MQKNWRRSKILSLNKSFHDTSSTIIQSDSCNPEPEELIPEHLFPLESLSTPPKRPRDNTDSSNNESHIENFTQNPSEVTWDFQSKVLVTDYCDKNNETPKRRKLINKRKNSPLMYRHVKKPLIEEDAKENLMQAFAADLKMLNKKITAPKNQSTDAKLANVEVSNLGASDIRLEFSISDDSFQSSSNKISMNIDSSNEFIEQGMIHCTQEIERKENLNIATDLTAEKKKELTIKSETKNQDSYGSKHNIPDDSFDEAFANIDEESLIIKNRKYDTDATVGLSHLLSNNELGRTKNVSQSLSQERLKDKLILSRFISEPTLRIKETSYIGNPTLFTHTQSMWSVSNCKKNNHNRICSQEEIDRKRITALLRRKQKSNFNNNIILSQKISRK